MNARHREQITDALTRLPEVEWDRLADRGDTVTVWGWLPATEPTANGEVISHDFVILVFSWPPLLGTMMVEAATSADDLWWLEISRRVFGKALPRPATQPVARVLEAVAA